MNYLFRQLFMTLCISQTSQGCLCCITKLICSIAGVIICLDIRATLTYIQTIQKGININSRRSIMRSKSCKSGSSIFLGYLPGAIAVAALLWLAGCATPAPSAIPSTNAVNIPNPMKRIALFSSSQVGWSAIADKGIVVDIRASKQLSHQI